MAGACTCTCTCLLVAATGEMTHRGSSSVFRTPDLGHLADRERGPVTTVVTYPDPATNLRGTSPSVASPAARVRLASADCGCRRKSGRVGNWEWPRVERPGACARMGSQLHKGETHTAWAWACTGYANGAAQLFHGAVSSPGMSLFFLNLAQEWLCSCPIGPGKKLDELAR